MTTPEFLNLVMAAVMGAAVGIDRERDRAGEPPPVKTGDEPAGADDSPAGSASAGHAKRMLAHFGGVRTFSLVAVFGFLGVHLYRAGFPWILPAAFLSVTGLMLVSHWKDNTSKGITSEVAFLITFLLGVLCGMGEIYASAFVMVITVALLSARPQIRAWVRNVMPSEIVTTVKFALISVVMLPLLPTKLPVPEAIRKLWPNLPYDLLNPYDIWLVVVLVSGIGFAGYIFNRLMGPGRGLLLTAFSGGLVSSTAVTMSFARRAMESTRPVFLAMGIILACLIMFPRMLLEAFVFYPPMGRALLWPMLGIAAGGMGWLAWLYFQDRDRSATEKGALIVGNPLSLKDGLLFGGLYLLIRLLAWFGTIYMGDWGVYTVALLSGLSDVDAITIGMAKSAAAGAKTAGAAGAVSLKTAVYAAYLAGVSNTVTKGIMVFVLAPRSFAKLVLPGFVIMVVIGFAFLFISV